MILKKCDLDDGCLQDHTLRVSPLMSATSAAGAAPSSLPAAAAGAADSHDGWVYRSREEIERTSPCRAAGMSMEQESALRYRSCQDIARFVEALAKLKRKEGTQKLTGRVIQVASIFFHRGYTRLSMAVDNPIVGAVTCVFLAAKVEEVKHFGLREVLSACRKIEQLTADTPDSGLKDRICRLNIGIDEILIMERRLLHSIAFEIFVRTPVKALSKIKGLHKTDRHAAQRFIHHSLRTSLCLQFPPRVMARAAVFLRLLEVETEKRVAQRKEGGAFRPLTVNGVPAGSEVVSWCQQMIEFYENLGRKTEARYAGKLTQRKRAEGPGAATSFLCDMLSVDPLSLPSPSGSNKGLAPLRNRSSYRSLKELGKGRTAPDPGPMRGWR